VHPRWSHEELDTIPFVTVSPSRSEHLGAADAEFDLGVSESCRPSSSRRPGCGEGGAVSNDIAL